MSNPFDDLEADDEAEQSSPDQSSNTTTEMQVTESTDEQAEATESESDSGPAFEYSEVQQKPFYARSETVSEFESNIRTKIVPKLAESGVLDEETREIHDAVLQLANEQPERVAELVLEARRES